MQREGKLNGSDKEDFVLAAWPPGVIAALANGSPFKGNASLLGVLVGLMVLVPKEDDALGTARAFSRSAAAQTT